MFEILINRLKKSLLDLSRCYSALPFILLDKHFSRTHKSENKSLAIIKIDEIGDYVLFRNFLEVIRNSKKFKDYHITLIGNILWKEIAEFFDRDFVNEFIWLDKKKLVKSFSYRNEKLHYIYNKNFEIIVNPVSSRSFLIDDSIIKAASSKERIGYFSDASNSPIILSKISNKYYTSLLALPGNIQFEFHRNKFFCENILEEKVHIEKTFLNNKIILPKTIPGKFVAVFPGASRKNKRWPEKKFAEVINYVKNNFNYYVIILGGKEDIETTKNIKQICNHSEIFDFTGQTSLIDLINYIGNAELLISNDTGAAHIGASANVNTIIISDGSRFGRFIPYPKEQANVRTIFPPEIMRNYDEKSDLLYKSFKYKSSLKISDIDLESIINEIDWFLKSNNQV